MPPSGNSTEATHAYYNWLYAQYLGSIPAPRTTIYWEGPFFIALWAVVLIGGFFFLAWFGNRTHRSRGELYGVSSFAGSILERIGPISRFSWVVWIATTLWALYYLVSHVLAGQVY